MTEFWLSVVLLLALALAFLFIPVFFRLRSGELVRQEANIQIYKDQLKELKAEFNAGRLNLEDYQSLSEEVKRNLLSDTDATSAGTTDMNTGAESGKGNRNALILVAVSSVLTIGVSLGLYQKLGAQNELAITDLLKRSFQENYSDKDAQELVVRLEQQVEQHPKDVESWYMLGRINFDLERFDQAVIGFNGVIEHLPETATEDRGVAIAQLAQAQFFANDRKLDPATESLLKEAIKLNPRESTALGLLGVANYERKDFLQAIRYWNQLLGLMRVDNPNVMAIRGGIEKAKSQLSAEEVAKLKSETPAGASISVTVNIAENVKSEVPKEADLFVMAKAETGPPMPLAVKRITVSEWPVTVELNDSMAMMPQLKLSTFQRVIITARISKSGVGNAKAGDIQGVSKPLSVDTKELSLAINEVVQ